MGEPTTEARVTGVRFPPRPFSLQINSQRYFLAMNYSDKIKETTLLA